MKPFEKMKRLNLLIISFLVVFLMSCDEEGGDYVLDTENIAGEIVSQEVTMDSSETYYLDGNLIVGYGGTLNIPAGTEIIVTGGTSSYLAVERGGKIYAEGTATSPIVFTSDVKEAGSWGGVVICGKARTNLMDETSDLVQAEVTNLDYGGDVAEDNSGILRYVRVEYSGYSYGVDKQFNGFSFFGVGSGTIIDHISSYESDDDGIEFFGGTVSADYVVSINSNDDGIDFTDGWQGKGEYWYSYNSAESGIEGSNNASDGDADDPTTYLQLSNVTVYKMGSCPWFLKEGTGQLDVNNIVIGGQADNNGYAYFYYVDDDESTIQNVANGNVVFEDVRFVNRGTGNDTDASGSLQITTNESSTGAGTWSNNSTLEPSWLGTWAKP